MCAEDMAIVERPHARRQAPHNPGAYYDSTSAFSILRRVVLRASKKRGSCNSDITVRGECSAIRASLHSCFFFFRLPEDRPVLNIAPAPSPA